MAKELFFYQSFNRWSAEDLNKQLSGIDRSEDITVRLNSPGGDVVGGDAVISMISEFTGKKTVIIDGEAASMAAIMLLYFDEVVVNDHGYENILFHKAAYPTWYEPNDSEKESLSKVNDSFKNRITKKVSGKIGSDDFLAKLFEDGKRNDVKLTPRKAKQLGIVTDIRKIEPTAYEGMSIVALVETVNNKSVNNNKSDKMEITQAQLEAARKEGFEAGVLAEHDRVGSFLAWAEIDLKAAVDGATTLGAKMTETMKSKFQIAAMKSTRLGDHAADNTAETGTMPGNPAAEAKTPEQKLQALKQAEIDDIMNLEITL